VERWSGTRPTAWPLADFVRGCCRVFGGAGMPEVYDFRDLLADPRTDHVRASRWKGVGGNRRLFGEGSPVVVGRPASRAPAAGRAPLGR